MNATVAPYRAFAPDSWWNSPTVGPPHPESARWIDWLKARSTYPYPRLTVSTTWALPIYWPQDGDPEYTIFPTQYGFPVKIRIPAGASPSTGSDGALVTIDVGRDETISLWRASRAFGGWTAAGTARYVLSSDGLCRTPPNTGHRGIPPAIMAIRVDELAAGAIEHRLEVFVPGTAPQAIYPPMCAYEPNRGGIIPEGAVLRVKPTLDLAALRLKPKALAIARALQTHGAVVGDNDPNVTTIKCQRGIPDVFASDLGRLPFDLLEFAA